MNSEATPNSEPAFTLLKQSRNELVVFKPAGLSSERPGDGVSLKSLVAQRFPDCKPKLPHRLDRVTRGLLLVCLTPEAITFHNQQIQARRWEKYYLARVATASGQAPEQLVGAHKAFLTEVEGRAHIVHSGGKPSQLEILAAAPVPDRIDRFHLLIRLQTGRFHQIRIMCSALGLPLPGDPLYDPAARDPAEFYLEHIILKYEDFDTRTRSTIFLRDYPERGAIAAKIETLLTDIAEEKGS